VKYILIVIAVVASIGLASWTEYVRAQASGPTVVRWEYQEVEITSGMIVTAKLNTLGLQGWELVGVSSACARDSACRTMAYLKRPW
jgi:hypothetical protein